MVGVQCRRCVDPALAHLAQLRNLLPLRTDGLDEIDEAYLHDWDDDTCRRILGSIKAAAEPGARLVVVEGIVPAGDEPHFTKSIDLVMLAMQGGKERSADEFEQLLSSAGFTLDRIVATPSPFSFLEATLRG